MNEYLGVHVLIVDDDPQLLEVVATILRSIGINAVRRAKDGQAAVDRFVADPNAADLVICDWIMPGLSGLSVFKRITKIKPNVVFIMLTQKKESGDVKEAVEAGIKYYVVKPFQPRHLARVVRAALAARTP